MEAGFPGRGPVATQATDTGIIYPRAGGIFGGIRRPVIAGNGGNTGFAGAVWFLYWQSNWKMALPRAGS